MLSRIALVTHITVTKFHMLKRVSLRRNRAVSVFLCFFMPAFLLAGCGVGNGVDGSDPVVIENPVAFIKRPLLFDDNNGDLITDDLTEPQLFRPGAVLYLKDSASPSADSLDISSSAFPSGALYDVRDLDVSYDGTKLIFSMRAPEIENADDEDQPKWNIWEYDITASSLRRLIASNTTAEEGHDLAPTYLPDGRILFSSTRQKTSKAILLDEDLGKSQFSGLDEDRGVESFALHVMDDDGLNIEQITFNQSHDLDPLVRADGKIVFSRWDNAGQTPNNGINLYEVNPDGTGLSYLYGRHSHDSGDAGSVVQFAKPRESENGQIVVQLREFVSEYLSVNPVEVNIDDYVEHDVEINGLNTNGQVAVLNGLSTSGEPSLNGNYGALFPLYDGTNRYLASWSVCRVQNILTIDQINAGETPTIEACTSTNLNQLGTIYEGAPPLYGLWIVDASSQTQLPIELPEEGIQFDEAVIMTERPAPTYIAPLSLDSDAQSLADAGYGVLHIRSVYDFDGTGLTKAELDDLADPAVVTPEDRPARFVRIEKPVAIPDDFVRDFDNSAYGVSRAQLMREILGYVPVEPDGSVKVAVPANVALAISVLDEQGQRITQRHQNWLQVRPGETVSCIGCHTNNSEVPHGRIGAEPDPVNTGAAVTGVEFRNSEPGLSPNMGETMAEVYARVMGTRILTPDIEYTDEWTIDAIGKATDLTLSYDDLSSPPPIANVNCQTSWTANCRVVINYETHIHPLWSVARSRTNPDMSVEDRTCTSCHTNTDDMGNPRVPEQQLDLSDGPSTDEPDHFKAYRELLANDNQQELDGMGQLVDTEVFVETIQVPRVDGNGDPVLDPDTGLQIIDDVDIFEPVIVPATMRTAGAIASADFMLLFQAGGTHEGDLSPSELKLLAEWLDIGAQYYNNPFDAPAN